MIGIGWDGAVKFHAAASIFTLKADEVGIGGAEFAVAFDAAAEADVVAGFGADAVGEFTVAVVGAGTAGGADVKMAGVNVAGHLVGDIRMFIEFHDLMDTLATGTFRAAEAEGEKGIHVGDLARRRAGTADVPTPTLILAFAAGAALFDNADGEQFAS